MRHLINQIKCLIIGHEWKEYWTRKGSFPESDYIEIITKCTRCGKVKEEWI